MYAWMKNIILSIICIVLLPISVFGQIQVVQKIDSISILIGEQAHLTVDITAPKGSKVNFPKLMSAKQIVPGLEIIDSQPTILSDMDNNQCKYSKTITLTAFSEKLYAIPALKVQVNGKNFQGNPLALKVLTVDVDTLHPNKFYPPKDVQSNPFMWSEWSPLFFLSILLVLLCISTIYLYVRLKQNKPIITKIKIIKHIPPHQKALHEIEKIKSDKMDISENVKEYYTKLTDTLRLYIQERFGFNAMEMTSTEIISQLRNTGDQVMLDELHSLFETADLVKFAKYSTLINENDLNLVNAVNFIDSTKQNIEPKEERIVPQLTENELESKKQRIIIKTTIGVVSGFAVILFGYIIYAIYQLIG